MVEITRPTNSVVEINSDWLSVAAQDNDELWEALSAQYCSHHHHHYQLPLTYTLDHSISMVRIIINSYEMCAAVLTNTCHVLLCCFLSTLNSLEKQKEFAVQDVPRD